MPAHPSLIELRGKVDAFWQKVLATESPGAYRCESGCSTCCVARLTVFPVEAQPIRELWGRMEPQQRQRILAQARRDEHCVFLHRGVCTIYEERPLVCRTQGLLLQLPDGRRDVCPLNLQGVSLDSVPPQQVLVLDRLLAILAILHEMTVRQGLFGEQRVSLEEIADS